MKLTGPNVNVYHFVWKATDRHQTSWTLTLGKGPYDRVDFCVTRHIDLPKDEWALHCNALGIRTFSLGRVTLEEAQAAAVVLVEGRLRAMLKAVEEWRNA